MIPMGAKSSNEMQWFDITIGYQGSNPIKDHQGDIPY